MKLRVGTRVKYELNKLGTGSRWEGHEDTGGNGFWAHGNVVELRHPTSDDQEEVFLVQSTHNGQVIQQWWPLHPMEGGWRPGWLTRVYKIRILEKDGYTYTEKVDEGY